MKALEQHERHLFNGSKNEKGQISGASRQPIKAAITKSAKKTKTLSQLGCEIAKIAHNT